MILSDKLHNAGLPIVIVKPSRHSVETSYTAAFTAMVKGVGPFNYQWRKGKHNLTNETQPTIVFKNVSSKDQNYYRCFVTNDYGDFVLSKRVFLRVTSE